MKKRVLIVGDAPHLKTGFGRINGIAASAFQKAGFDVGAVSGLTLNPPDQNNGITMFYPEQGDVLGVMRAASAVEEFDPDVIYHTGEPGTMTAFSRIAPVRLPFVAYVPIEGEPIVNHDWRNILSAITVFTCSEYGAKVVKRDVGIDIPWVYHGIDHDVFKVNGRRDMVRKMAGWDNKFVIITVATNVRRKQHPRLFEALKILKERYKQTDIVLYDHTIPFDGYWLEGWNLPELAHSMGLYNEIVFNPAMAKNNDAIPEVAQFDNLGLVDLYNAADLFVLPSQVEGFGLPIAEAMACGVPVMVTQYAAGWEVARPAGIPIPVKDWEIHKSGTRYANADIEGMAKEILRIKRNERDRGKRSALGLQRVRDFSWSNFTEKLIAITERAITEKAASQEVPPDQEEEPQDQGLVTSEPTSQNDTRPEDQAEDRPASSTVETSRTSEDFSVPETPGLSQSSSSAS